ncbi:MAG: hypothetical protein AB8G99_15875 [Planctomycetaceae bacterium]
MSDDTNGNPFQTPGKYWVYIHAGGYRHILCDVLGDGRDGNTSHRCVVQ